MVPASTRAPTLTKHGISTTPGAMKAERRTTLVGTARNPASRNRCSVQLRNFDGTLSHQPDPPGPPPISAVSLSRNESSTAFLSHW